MILSLNQRAISPKIKELIQSLIFDYAIRFLRKLKKKQLKHGTVQDFLEKLENAEKLQSARFFGNFT